MLAVEAPLPAQRPRKPTHTYSLIVHGGGFRLTGTLPSASSHTPAPVQAPLPPIIPAPTTPQPCPAGIPSSPRRYAPCIPLPQATRSNLYLFRPTAADLVKEKKRAAARAAALEAAQKRREEDERRRNIMLGITGPRKSARISKARTASAASASGRTAAAAAAADDSHPKGSRGGRKPAASSGVASAPPAPSLPAPEPAPPPKQLRRKPQPKRNPRPTERLTTRSLARAKSSSGSIAGSDAGGATAPPPSEAGEHEDDVEMASACAQAAPNAFVAPRGEEGTVLGTPQGPGDRCGAHPLSSRASSPTLGYRRSPLSPSHVLEDEGTRSGASTSSSDTLCDASGTGDIKAELLADVPSSALQLDIPGLGHSSASPATSMSTGSLSSGAGGKRQLELAEAEDSRTERRRSGRVIKKRKLQ